MGKLMTHKPSFHYKDAAMKNKAILFLSLIACLIFVLLLVFIFSNMGKRVPSSKAGCMPLNLTTIPSPMPQRKSYGSNIINPPSMPSWWKPQLNFLQQIQLENISLKNSAPQDMVIYEDQVWIAYSESIIKNNSGKFSVYRIPIGTSKENYLIEDLYVAKSSIMWVILAGSSSSAIARYDTVMDKFVVITDKAGILNQSGPLTWPSIPLAMSEMSNGSLVFTLGQEIFSYDPVNQQAQKLLGLESGLRVDTLAVAKDDSIWFTTVNDFFIRSLDPVTGKINEHGEPPSLIRNEANQTGLARESRKAITIDNNGRVWVGYFDRLEPDDKNGYFWQELDHSPIFVDIYDSEVYTYKWSPVISVAQFSDGDLWFSAGVGVVQYSISKDSWCWVAPQPVPATNTFSLIYEDENGNIWMINMDARLDQIYKLEQ